MESAGNTFSKPMQTNSLSVMSHSVIQMQQLSNEQTRAKIVSFPAIDSKRKTTSFQNVTALKLLLNSIALLPKTQPQIVEITGLANSTVSRWLNFLHVSNKEVKNLVYIADWKRTGERGNWAACWAMGYGMADKPKPKPMTMSEYNKRWRAKKARTAEIIETEKGIKHVSR